MRLTRLFTAALVTLAACQKAETPEQAATRMEQESAAARTAIEAQGASFAAHFSAGHGDSVAAFYTENGEILPPNGPAVSGRANIAGFMNTGFGMGSYADELVLTMNRAAEAAVPEAKQLFVDSVKKMSVQDAKGILTGGETAGTAYFKRTTSDQLRKRFLPIVKKSTAKVGLAQTYNQYAQQAAAFGLVKAEDANLDNYVTQKALDGVYLMVAEEERKIRKDPVGAASSIIKKVFGAL